jgi:aminomethyltransferase
MLTTDIKKTGCWIIMEPKETSLLPIHRQLKARIVEFAGFLMPLQYSGVVDEHLTVRRKVGLFDVSHMGQIDFCGPQALPAVHRLVTNNVLGLQDGQVLYTPICYPDGGIVDDCLVYRHRSDHVQLVVNASNVDKDYAWVREQTAEGTEVLNRSDEYALLALQGPKAAQTVHGICDPSISEIPSFSFRKTRIKGVDCVASRTGYTGEDGFEIACAMSDGPTLWNILMEAGSAHGIKPCGLGARDTLRLEARLMLYGNDIDATTTPLEAGLGWTVKMEAGDFIGREALQRQKEQGLKRKLVCLQMKSRGIARHGHEIYAPAPANGVPEAPIGAVTSGTMAPFLEKAIAMAYVAKEHSANGTLLEVDVRGKRIQAEVIKGPFYQR